MAAPAASTKQVIFEMLTENTGRHMLDSGGAYGRNWERNKEKTIEDFEKEPECDYEVDLTPWPFNYNYDTKQRELKKPLPKGLHASINPTISLYHWLNKRLDFDADMQEHLVQFAARDDQKDESWFGVLENWLEHIEGKYLDWNDSTIHDEDGDGLDLIKVGGPDGDKPMTVNSYNHECDLSQTIQFTLFTLTGDRWSRDGRVYCALMVHGGCDVRGGYTAPKIFQVCSSEWTSILDFDRVEICGGCGENAASKEWFAIRWLDRSADHEGMANFPPALQALAKTDIESFPVKILKEGQTVPKKRGIIYVAHDLKTAYCPFTGTPITTFVWPE